jgi:putative ABC transport system permease protein
MLNQVLRVTWYRFRATFGSRWGGYLTVVLLVGLLGGLAMGSVAGARRTDSSFPIYLASTNPSSIMVLAGFDDPGLGQRTGYDPGIVDAISHLPHVEHSATSFGFDGNIDLSAVRGTHPDIGAGETPPTVIGGEEYLTMDRVTLVEGRLADPQRTDEAVMNAQAATEWGLHLGSVIGIPFYTDTESTSPSYNGPPHLVAKVELVGEVVFSSSVVEDDIDRLGSAVVLLSPALTAEVAPCCTYYSGDALQVAGGESNQTLVHEEAARVTPLAGGEVAGGGSTPATVVTKAQQAIKPEAVALGVFGGIAGLAVLLIAGLMIGRILRAGTVESATLRALGANQAMTLSDGLVGLLGAVVGGSVLAFGVAVALSPLTPLGPVRPVYPYKGFAFDWTVLGLGLVALVLVLGSLAVILAGRELSRLASTMSGETWKQERGVVRSAAGAGLPIAVVTGLRFALESGRGRNSVPVRSAIFGAVLAIAVLVTTVTFGASLNNLVSHPALYGWNWNYALLSGFAGQEDLPADQTAALLDKDPDVAGWSGLNFVGAELDGLHVLMLTERPGAAVAPPLLSGHGLDASNQVVLGATTLLQLHRRLGDTVTFSVGKSRPRRLVIVGTATMASIAKGLEMGSGALVATSDFPASLLNAQESPISGPNAVVIRIRAGVDPTAAYRSLEEIATKINAIPGDAGAAGGVVSVLRPAEIVNYRSMGTTPAILSFGLALGAVAALGLTLVASVRRRRRDLALLKTLGFTQRQTAAAIAWQSSVAVVIGMIIGVPVGIIIGRSLWVLFAHEINAVPAPIVPGTLIAVMVVGALALANIVAAVPGRIAARTPTSLLLRAE